MTAGLVAGVDIGGSKALAVVVDDANRVLGQVRLPTERGAAGVVATAAEAVRQATEMAGSTLTELTAVGVGIPGLVHPSNGSVSHAVNLDLGADPVDLSAALQRELGVPVSVENDVNAVAVGAHRLAGARRGDLAVLSIGTGLAAGIVVDGSLHRGSRGGAGEIGHIPVDPLGRWCSCGQRGCLETIASGSALSAAWQPAHEDGSSVWSAAGAGEESAAAAVRSFGAGVAAAVRLLVLAWDVEHVVLAGGVTGVGQPLLDVVRSELLAAEAGSAFLAAMRLPERVSLLPSQSPVAAVGAAVLARDSLLESFTAIPDTLLPDSSVDEMSS
ncbi:ROK family protein [Angustibacter sp. McL0619]|uniref:ROK family protein n=1 Tax=Angustibacter sp. McL0619 TaxID=3415676 RepID=UPI003CEC12E6